MHNLSSVYLVRGKAMANYPTTNLLYLPCKVFVLTFSRLVLEKTKTCITHVKVTVCIKMNLCCVRLNKCSLLIN